jgi:hypothetical protein
MSSAAKDLKAHEFSKRDKKLTCVPQRRASVTSRRSGNIPGVQCVPLLAEAPRIDAGPYGQQPFQFR